MSHDKHDYQPSPYEDSVAEQLERNDISEEAKRLSQWYGEEDEEIAPLIMALLNLLGMIGLLALIAGGFYWLIHSLKVVLS